MCILVKGIRADFVSPRTSVCRNIGSGCSIVSARATLVNDRDPGRGRENEAKGGAKPSILYRTGDNESAKRRKDRSRTEVRRKGKGAKGKRSRKYAGNKRKTLIRLGENIFESPREEQLDRRDAQVRVARIEVGSRFRGRRKPIGANGTEGNLIERDIKIRDAINFWMRARVEKEGLSFARACNDYDVKRFGMIQ